MKNNVTSIGKWAFNGCKNLKNIKLSRNLAAIEEGVFGECEKLESITIPDSVTSIGNSAFSNCTGLASVSIPDSVTKIGDFSFAVCESLTSITIPESVVKIGHSAFSQCSGMTSVTFEGDAPVFSPGDGEYENFWRVTATAYYPAGNETWTSSVMKNYGGKITWEAKVMPPNAPAVEIENVAFSGKPKLTWDAASNAVKYEVYRATSQNGTYKKLATVSSTSLTNSSAEAGKTYYYKVRSVGVDGTRSDFSNIVSSRCDLPRPVVTLTNIASSGKIKVSWDAIDGAVKYKVYYSTDKENWTLLKTTTGTNLTHSSTEAGKLYYYKVMAIASTSAANSAFSSVKSRTCDLARPTLTVSLNSKDKPYLTWTAVSGAAKYEVYRSTDGENWTLMKTTTSTKLTHSSAVDGRTYYYKVRAIASISSANSAYSTVKSVKAG